MSAIKKLIKILAISLSLLAPSFSMAGSGIILPPTSGGGGGSGDVTAASSFGTDNLLIRSDGTGKGVQSSAITVDDSGNVSGVGSISASSMSLSSLTASTALALDGSKNLVSVTNTGSGNNVLATSPTLTTPTLGSATATSVAGANGSGAFSLRAGTTAADSLVLSSRDVDGATNIPFVTLTSNNTPSMAINVPAGTTGTMDGVTIGGTTAAAGTFTTISQSGVHTFSANSTITSGNYQIGRNASNQFVFNSPGQAFVFSSNGTQRLFLDDFQYNFSQGAASGGTFTAVRVTGGAHTGLTASTESSDVVYALNRTVQFSTGALTNQRAVVINGQTIAFVGASTVTNAITLDVDAPTAGTNATITNNFAARFNGSVAINTAAASTLVFQNTAQITTTTSDGAITLKGNRNAASATSDIVINSSVARTAGNLLAIQNNAAAQLTVGFDGKLTIQPSAQSSGVSRAIVFTTPNHTGQTASTEASNFLYSTYTRTWAAGALTTQREIQINAPTYAFASASTLTTGATMAISGAPIAGTNATLTNSYALWIQSGFARFDGGISLDSTLTAGGTTGAQTINKAAGSVNFAATATTLVVTDSLVKTNSIVITTAMTNDATCSVKDVEVASGSFTIRMNAACTAETKVGFVVYN